MRLQKLGEALRRIGEGAAMMRTKGEPGTGGDVVEAVRHARTVYNQIRHLQSLPMEEVMTSPKTIRLPTSLCPGARTWQAPSGSICRRWHCHPSGRCADDAAWRGRYFCWFWHLQIRQPTKRAEAIVKATAHYNDPGVLAEVSRNLGEAMVGRSATQLPDEEKMSERGW